MFTDRNSNSRLWLIEDNFFKKIIADIANSTVKFDEKGDGLGRYTIYNYQVDKDNKTDYKVRYPYNSGNVTLLSVGRQLSIFHAYPKQ